MSNTNTIKRTYCLDRATIELKREFMDAAYNEYWAARRTKKFKENHIFDENKTVRWNKEEVIRRNEKIDKEIKETLANCESLSNDYNEFIYTNAMEAYGYSRAVVEKIYSKAYEDSHSNGYKEVLSKFEELLDFVKDVMDLMK